MACRLNEGAQRAQRAAKRVARRLTGWLALAILLAAPAARAEDHVAQMLAAVEQCEQIPVAEMRAALERFTEEDVAKLCGMLVAPGTGEDTIVRRALHGLTCCAAAPDRGNARDRLAAALCANLPRLTGEPRGFVLEQLALVGTPAHFPAVADCLGDADNGPLAVSALASIGGSEALAALQRAFAGAQGATRVAIVEALERLGSRAAADDLLRHAHSNDLDLRAACLDALAACGAVSAGEALLDAVSAREWFDYTRAASRMVRYARAMAANGDTEPAAELLEALLKLDESESSVHLRIAALEAWAGFEGGPQFNRIMAKALDANPEVRRRAIEIAARVPSNLVVPELLKFLGHGQAAVREAALAVLERRADAAALPAILHALEDESSAVRVAAIRAAVRVGGAAVIADLLRQGDSPREEVRDALRAELQRVPGAAASAALMDAIPSVGPAARALALDVLVARRSRSVAPRVLALLDDSEEPVRIAALHAVGVLCGAEALPGLLQRAGRDADEQETEALEQTVAECARRGGQGDAAAAPILAALDLKRPAAYVCLLRAAGQVGGAAAFQTVCGATSAAAPEIREAAAQALRDWPDPTVAAEILRIAADAEDETLAVLAFRGFARLAALDPQRDARQKVELLQAGLAVARRPEERKLALSMIGEVGDASALNLLEKTLADAALRQEAAWALLNVSDRILVSHAHRVAEALDQVEASGVSGVNDRISALRERLSAFEGLITDWFVSGPYMEAGRTGSDLFDVVFPPETSERKDVRWTPQPANRDPQRAWMIDLTASVGGDHRVAYLLTQLYSPTAQKAQLEVGSDDGIKVWLNGAVVHANNVARGCQRGDDRVDVELRKGWNELLLKVNNLGGGWGACVRVAGPDRKPLKDVYAQAEATP